MTKGETLTTASGDGFLYSEARYASKVGLSRDEIQKIRRRSLVADTDWKKKGGHEIALTRAAIVKLCRLLRTRPSTLDLSACEFATTARNGAAGEALAMPDAISATNPKTLTVKKLWVNPRVLYAADELGEEMHVIVGRNDNFVIGMTLPAMPDPLHEGFWCLVGPLPPRKGRWY